MLSWGYITQEGCTIHSCYGTANGCCNMVIARRNICYQWPQYIERCSLTNSLLYLHIGRNLIHRHMTRSLNHNLYILSPSSLSQLTKAYQLLNLAYISSISQTARTAGITKRNGNIVFTANIQNLIIIFIERILIASHGHPGKNQGTTPRNNIHLSLVLLNLVNGLAGNTTMEGNKIHTILSMKADNINKILGSQGIQISLIVNNTVINRYSTNHYRAFTGKLTTERLSIAVTGQVHNSLCAHIYSRHNLFHFHIIVLAISGHAKVYINLGAQHGANTLWLQTFVVNIGRNSHLATSYQRQQLIYRHMLLGSNLFNFWSHNPLAGCFHLSFILFSHI